MPDELKINSEEQTPNPAAQAAPEILGADLADKLSADGTVIIEDSPVVNETPTTNTTTVTATPSSSENLTPEKPGQAPTSDAPPVAEEIPVEKPAAPVPPKEFSLESQREIVDQITDTYIPHPVGNSD